MCLRLIILIAERLDQSQVATPRRAPQITEKFMPKNKHPVPTEVSAMHFGNFFILIFIPKTRLNLRDIFVSHSTRRRAPTPQV